MICIIALIVFSILGIFSASHRIIAKEAFECVFRRLTLRKCETGLDKRLKAQITGKLMKKTPKTGKWIYKHFELISWFFLILLLASIFFSAQAGYYFIKYGNCNGENSDKFCIFDPLGKNNPDEPAVCAAPGAETTKEITAPEKYQDNPSFGNSDAKVTIIEYGCFSCPNTKSAVPLVQLLLNNYQEEVQFFYLDFPLPTHEFSRADSIASECVWKLNTKNYWDFHFKVFENQEDLSVEMLRNLAESFGTNMELYDECIVDNSSAIAVEEDYQKGLKSNIYGTPTFFINGEPVVGAITTKEFKKAINSALNS